MKQLGIENENYVHHIPMELDQILLITENQVLSLVHNKNKTMLKIQWSISIKKIINLPIIEDGMLYINLENEDESITIENSNQDKLRSAQQGLEYALLLTMPFKCSNYISKLQTCC